jgi:hypothetical protein
VGDADGRSAGLERFLDHVLKHEDVWICRREELPGTGSDIIQWLDGLRTQKCKIQRQIENSRSFAAFTIRWHAPLDHATRTRLQTVRVTPACHRTRYRCGVPVVVARSDAWSFGPV